MTILHAIATTASILALTAATAAAPATATESVRNIVLVHGAFADGSGWKARCGHS